MLDPGEDDTTHLSNKSLFPTEYSVHTLQIKRRPSDEKRVAIGFCFSLYEDVQLQLIYPTELNDPIICGNCKSYED